MQGSGERFSFSDPRDVANSDEFNAYRAMTIGERINIALGKRNRSQAWLGEKIDMSQSEVSKALVGKKRLFFDQVEAIAQALEMPIEELLDLGSDRATDHEMIIVRYIRRLGLTPDDAIFRLNQTPESKPPESPFKGNRTIPAGGSLPPEWEPKPSPQSNPKPGSKKSSG